MSHWKSIVCGLLFLGMGVQAKDFVVYEGKDGPGKGKQIVFLSGDEEYRSEEALPQLAKILATRHGFKCTVLFAINPETREIDPNYQKNIPGMEALDSADLVVMSWRFRDLPDELRKQFANAAEFSGGVFFPAVGIVRLSHVVRFISR